MSDVLHNYDSYDRWHFNPGHTQYLQKTHLFKRDITKDKKKIEGKKTTI